ncbi:MAG: hypothetical protein ACI4V5_05555 [Prevotella sp.]
MKCNRNPVVWRGVYLNFSRTSDGRLQPHFRDVSLTGSYDRALFPYAVANELHKALKELYPDDRVEESGLSQSQREC